MGADDTRSRTEADRDALVEATKETLEVYANLADTYDETITRQGELLESIDETLSRVRDLLSRS